MENNPQTVVMVAEQPRRRRLAGMIGCISLGAALLAGTTMAAFTDRESARFGDDNNGIKTASHNIQIRPEQVGNASDAWQDTENDNAGETEANKAPINLVLTGGPMLPGDETSAYKAKFEVRVALESGDSKLTLKLEDLLASTADAIGTGDLADWLKVDVTWNSTKGKTGTTTGKTFKTLSGTNSVVLTDRAVPGEVFTVGFTIYLDGAADSSVANRALDLKAVVTGEAI
ncbi:MAG: SipW-dependent-type signal peptide-containing protein [Bifidobacteriaceae bacterium]|jgi:predicted ribosomally synthesized peptide with SipW-like signal peptide|nr:SipW-dependent-type signal peptide-containing protein [Bifidobacteriaceae bacterium]